MGSGSGRVLLFSRVWLFCFPMGCSPLGSSVRGIFQARTLEWVAIPSFRGPSRHRDQASVYCTDRQILYHWAIKELHAGKRGNLLKSISLVTEEDSSFYQSQRVILCNWWDLLIHSLNSYLLRMFCQEIHSVRVKILGWPKMLFRFFIQCSGKTSMNFLTNLNLFSWAPKSLQQWN